MEYGLVIKVGDKQRTVTDRDGKPVTTSADNDISARKGLMFRFRRERLYGKYMDWANTELECMGDGGVTSASIERYVDLVQLSSSG